MVLGIDWAVGMPLLWTIGEGPCVILLGGVIFWPSGRQPFHAASAHPALSGQ